MSEPVKIVIIMGGGEVTAVVTAGVPVDYIILDYTDGSMGDDAFASRGSAQVDGPWCVELDGMVS